MNDKIYTYLCGGINNLSDRECKDWREYAKECLKTNSLDPMRRDYRGIESYSVNEIVLGDIEDIHNSEFILVNASKPSWGTAMEIVYSFKMNKTIIAFTMGSKVSPWLTYHCDKVVDSINEAIDFINSKIL